MDFLTGPILCRGLEVPVPVVRRMNISARAPTKPARLIGQPGVEYVRHSDNRCDCQSCARTVSLSSDFNQQKIFWVILDSDKAVLDLDWCSVDVEERDDRGIRVGHRFRLTSADFFMLSQKTMIRTDHLMNLGSSVLAIHQSLNFVIALLNMNPPSQSSSGSITHNRST